MESPTRSCGSCTACCEGWLVINIEAIQCYPGHPCKHVVCGKSCAIYETRPTDPCRNFYCNWVLDTNGKFPEWMIPENSKAIVIKDKLAWKNKMLDIVVPVGPAIPTNTLKWLVENAKKHNIPFVYTEHKLKNNQIIGDVDIKVYAPQPMRDNILAWLDAGNKLW